MAAKKTSKKKKTAKPAAAKAKRTSKKSTSTTSNTKKAAKPKPGSKRAVSASAGKSSRSSASASTNRRPKAASSGKSGEAKTSRKQTATSKSRAPGSKASPKPTRPADAPWEEPEELPKTRLTDKQLDEFKTMLLTKRKELTGDVRNLTQDALGRNRQDASGDLSNMPIHMADLGSDNWEQEFTLGLIANEQQLVREIDHALSRIEDRTYGVCMGTGKPIKLARLRAKPWAKYCIEYARQRELGRV